MTTFDWHDQQFVLRVTDPGLASRLRGWLREEVDLNDKLALTFEGAELQRAARSVWVGRGKRRVVEGVPAWCWGKGKGALPPPEPSWPLSTSRTAHPVCASALSHCGSSILRLPVCLSVSPPVRLP